MGGLRLGLSLRGLGLAADRGLDRDQEQVARDEVLEALAHAAAALPGHRAVDDQSERVDPAFGGSSLDELSALSERLGFGAPCRRRATVALGKGEGRRGRGKVRRPPCIPRDTNPTVAGAKGAGRPVA
jgi:hypothetical protein